MLRYRRAFGLALAVVTFLLALGAVYAGFHYVIDIFAGLVVGVSAVTCAAWFAPDITAFRLGLRNSQTRLT
jgi:membrane-associated phospholipid phosphatase